MFSIPLNPKLNNIQLNHFYEFCLKHKQHIYDIYFTCRMPPFEQDAMGDVFENPMDLIDVALKLQDATGIRMSATFNNTLVPVTQQNLDIFITNFQVLYDAGIRSVTIPHTHWVATGQIQKQFPELLIKNTILRQPETAKDVANLGKEGFHYVNIHRDLMRDRETLERIRKAADKYNLKIALLANEGCHGGCSMMKEHFEYNNNRKDNPQYFNDPISRVSCAKWDVQDPATPLKQANIPPWREDWIDLLNVVDVFKMHGRENVQRFYETMRIVENFAQGKEILFDTFNQYLQDNTLENRPIDAWRKIIKTCKFDCWDCNFCDKVYQSKSNLTINPTVSKVADILVDHVNSDYDNSIQGLTSPRVKKLLNSLAGISTNYLEIGTAMGSSAVSVLDAGVPTTCVDNWQDSIQPESGAFELPDNNKDIFLSNVKNYNNITVHDEDLFAVQLEDKYDLFFYDGPHDEQSVIDAVKHYKNYFADTSILVFDDANWEGVVSGALQGLTNTEFDVKFSRMILNSVEDSTKWWNGLYLLVVTKNESTETITS
tara:strand:+ start:16721 stop:18352 length:1632 start_codon:yes stop_codon:yes gene_type:complete